MNRTSPGQVSLPEHPQRLDGAPTIGDKTAGVVVIQYSDFECSFCAAFARDTWPILKREYVDSGKVLIAFRHLPLPRHQFARRAAESAVCAARQGKFWEMHDVLFAHPNNLDEAASASRATALGLRVAEYEACLKDDGRRLVERDLELAHAIRVIATPTFIIGTKQANDAVKATHILVGAQPITEFRSVLDGLLEAQRTRFRWFDWSRR